MLQIISIFEKKTYETASQLDNVWGLYKQGVFIGSVARWANRLAFA